VFLDELSFLRGFKSVAVLELCVKLTRAYDLGTVQFWYLLIDMDYILFYVKFEVGLSVTILRNRVILHKKLL
jgi:hypothetical protein